MTSSLGDQLSALLGKQAPGTPGSEASETAGTAAELGSNGVQGAPGSGKDLPAGVHGEVGTIVQKMANDEVKSLALATKLSNYGFDRLGVVELAIRCEEELGVRVEDEDISAFKTLGDVVDYIAARRG